MSVGSKITAAFDYAAAWATGIATAVTVSRRMLESYTDTSGTVLSQTHDLLQKISASQALVMVAASALVGYGVGRVVYAAGRYIRSTNPTNG